MDAVLSWMRPRPVVAAALLPFAGAGGVVVLEVVVGVRRGLGTTRAAAMMLAALAVLVQFQPAASRGAASRPRSAYAEGDHPSRSSGGRVDSDSSRSCLATVFARSSSTV